MGKKPSKPIIVGNESSNASQASQTSKKEENQEVKQEANTNMNRVVSLSESLDWDKVKYSVFTYGKRSQSIKHKMKNVSKVLDHINQLQFNLNEYQEVLDRIGARINVLMNNMFKIKPKFDYKKHFIIVNASYVEIHDNEELNDAIIQNEIEQLHIEDEDEFFSLLIGKTKRKFKATKKQLKLCQELSSAYAEIFNEYNVCKDDYETAIELHDMLLEEIKEDLNEDKKNIVNLTPYKNEIEPFDEELHDLVAIKKDGDLEVFFMRKENKDEFMDQVNTAIMKDAKKNLQDTFPDAFADITEDEIKQLLENCLPD